MPQAPASSYLVLGAVTRLSMEHRTSTGGGVVPIPIVGGLIKKKKTDSILGLTIRMVDVRTGEIITTTTVEGSSSGNTSSGGGVAAFVNLPFVAGKHSSATGIQDGLLANAVGEAVAAVAEHLKAAAPRLIADGSWFRVPRSAFWVPCSLFRFAEREPESGTYPTLHDRPASVV